MQLTKTQFLSDHAEEITNFCNQHNNVLLVSPTGTGKTTYFLNDYFKSIDSDKVVIFAVPTQWLIDDLKGDKKEVTEGITYGYGREFYNRNKSAKRIVTTYDTALNWSSKVDVFIMDEAHLLAGAGEYRSETIESILNLKCKKIYTTGTACVIDRLEEMSILKVTKPRSNRMIRPVYLEGGKSWKHLDNVINARRSDRNLYIVILNNIERLRELQEKWGGMYNIIVKHSVNNETVLYENQSKEIVKKLEGGVVDDSIDILLATTILEAGVSLQVSRNVKQFYYAPDSCKMPNLNDTMQFFGRVRESNKVKIEYTLIGQKFGSFIFDNDKIKQSIPTDQKLFNLINLNKSLEKLNKKEYIQRFKEHGYLFLPMNLYYAPEHTYDFKGLPRVSNVGIIKNIQNYPDQYERIKAVAIEYNHLPNADEWIALTSGEVVLGTLRTNKSVIEIADNIIFCIKNDIPHEWLCSDSIYYQNRIEALKQISNTISRKNYKSRLNDIVVILSSLLLDNDVAILDKSYYSRLDKNQKKIFTEFNTLMNGQPNKRGRDLKVINSKLDEDKRKFLLSLVKNDIGIYKKYLQSFYGEIVCKSITVKGIEEKIDVY